MLLRVRKQHEADKINILEIRKNLNVYINLMYISDEVLRTFPLVRPVPTERDRERKGEREREDIEKERGDITKTLVRGHV